MDDKKMRIEAAQRMKDKKYSFIGFLIAPIFMWGVWTLTKDSVLVKNTGYYIFITSSVTFTVAYSFFSRFSNKLDNVRQDFSFPTGERIGNPREVYRVEYQFDLFSSEQFEAFKKMHFFGQILVGALFCIFGWVITIFIFRNFVW